MFTWFVVNKEAFPESLLLSCYNLLLFYSIGIQVDLLGYTSLNYIMPAK